MEARSRVLRALTIAWLVAGSTLPHAVPAQQPASADTARAPQRTSPSLTISGQQMSRYEWLDPQFRPGLGEDDRVLALRTSLAADVEWPRWRLIGELVDARAELNDANSTLTTGVVNTLELLQLAGQRTWTNIAGSGTEASLSLGRMTVDLGGRRLISRSVFRNTRTSYAGVDWTWHAAANQVLRAFYLAPMLALPGTPRALLGNEQRLDEVAKRTRLSGLYYERPVSNRGDRMDVYWIALEASEPTDRRDIDTFGVHFRRPPAPGRWHYEVELMRQSGRSAGLVGDEIVAGLDHDARYYHLDLGYGLKAPTSPALTIELDSASGDDDPYDARDERFDTLYGSRRFDFGPTGIYGPFARANLETPGIRLTLKPASAWTVDLSFRRYRLASPTDSWTTTGLRDPTGRSGDSLGRQVEASVSFRPEGCLRVDFGAARFSKGQFVRRTAPQLSEASVYYYVETTVSFLGAHEQ